MKRICFLIYFFVSINLISQVNESFDDGNFTTNPSWNGNNSSFIINDNNQLQLYDDAEGISCLTTPSNTFENTEWRCWIKLAFSPSSNNYARYYLASNSNDLSIDPDGFFLQFGESGSADAIELFKQKGNEITSVLRSEDGLISSSFELSVKVTRDITGNWKLYLDKNGTSNYLFECEGFDNEKEDFGYLGFLCKYTVSNSTKMYFDDIYAGDWQIDDEPPTLENLTVLNDSVIQLTFSEYLDSTQLQLSNFTVNEDIGSPDFLTINEDNLSVIDIIFRNKFQQAHELQLTIKNIFDLSGNQIIPITVPFCFYEPRPLDIVINEIMADPTPSLGLPEYEYIELHNTTNIEIDLSGWSFIIGNTSKPIENVKIPEGGYLILAKYEALSQLGQYSATFGFSSFSLTNGGQSLTLLDDENNIISEVTYDDSWYDDDEKSNGGWSMELINHLNICSTNENWTASINELGGSPGFKNSINSDEIFTPIIEKVILVTRNTIELIFSQNMDENSITNSDNYLLMGQKIEAGNIYSNADDQLFIVFENDFDTGVIYELTINSTIENCNGVKAVNDMYTKFGIPENPEYMDIVINEVLFDPWTNGEEYLEILNTSDKILDLRDIDLSYVHQTIPNPPDTSTWKIADEQKLFLPGEYCLMTRSPSMVYEQYATNNIDAFWKIEEMPALNNEMGHLMITFNEIIIDTFSYNEELHFPLLNYFDGVSLEKIDPEISLTNNVNWHSAAESAGFGTPGCINSQYNNFIDQPDEINIYPEVFTPDNDGYNDIQSINIKFNTSANTISIKVFSSKGFLVKDLVNNEYTGTNVSYSWDGITENNMLAPTDIYIYMITIFNTDGNVRHYKKAGVLSNSK
jgi:hypothetical protein